MAAMYAKTNSGKVLEIVDIDRPTPKDNEVLIRIRAAWVNPLDWRLKSRRPGVDVAGEVVSAGERVTQFKTGDAVFGTCRSTFAEYACAAETALFTKPDSLTFQQAASVPVAGLTALQGLRDKGRLQPGQKVLINGAAGGVGTFAVQIAGHWARQLQVCAAPGMSKWCDRWARRISSTTHRKTSQGTDAVMTWSSITSETARSPN